MNNIDDKTLIEMASGVSTEDEYYTKALHEISQNKTPFWNWSAGLFQEYWLLYHKMFAEFYIFWLLKCAFIMIIPSIKILSILMLILCGLYGNKFLFDSLKRKINGGYLLLPQYKTTDIAFVFLMLTGICLLCLTVGMEIGGFRGNGDVSLILVGIPILIYAIIKTIIFPLRDKIRATSYKKAS